MSVDGKMDSYPDVGVVGAEVDPDMQSSSGLVGDYMNEFAGVTPSLQELAATDGEFPPQISALNVAFAATMQHKGMPVHRALFAKYPDRAFHQGNKPRALQPYWMVMQGKNLAGDNLTNLIVTSGRQVRRLDGQDARSYKPYSHDRYEPHHPTVDFRDTALGIVPGGKLVGLYRSYDGPQRGELFPMGDKLTWRVSPKAVNMKAFYGEQEPPTTEEFVGDWKELLVSAVGRYVDLAKRQLHTDGVVDVHRTAEYYRNRSSQDW